MLKVLIFVIISYLLGSLPNGLYVANLKGIDIRNEGSKNTGATNVFRVMGAWAIGSHRNQAPATVY